MIVCGKRIRIDGRMIRTARVSAEGYEFIDSPDDAVASLGNCGTRIDLFTFTQRLSDTVRKGGYAMELDNLAVLPISTYDNWWQEIGPKTRNKARLGAKKGVIVREAPFDDVFADGVWRIYNECRVRQGRPFPHYNKDLDTVRKMTSEFLDRSIFIGAFLGEALIGFIKLTMDESRSQAGIMYILSMVEHRDKSPTNALLAQAVRSCAERGVANCVYSKFSFGKKRDSLRDFKENNGFRRVDIPRYYVPLTSLGRHALHLGLHRGVHGYVPEALLDKVHELRAFWYKHRFGAA